MLLWKPHSQAVLMMVHVSKFLRHPFLSAVGHQHSLLGIVASRFRYTSQDKGAIAPKAWRCVISLDCFLNGEGHCTILKKKQEPGFLEELLKMVFERKLHMIYLLRWQFQLRPAYLPTLYR